MDSLIKGSRQVVAFKDLENEHARRILTDFWATSPQLGSLDALTLVPLTLGRSGAGLYKFTVRQQDYVLRLFSPVDHAEDRKREASVSRFVGGHPIAPKVYYTDPKFEGMIIAFLPGRTLLPKDVQTAEGMAAFAQFLRQVHALSIEGYSAKSHFERADEWLQIAKEKGVDFPEQFKKAYQAMGVVKEVLDRIPVKPVLIHNDLIPLNIMMDGTSFKLVDWPAAGMGDPFWDLIDFTVFLGFDDTQTRTFLSAYLERAVTPEEWDRFVVMRPVPSVVRAVGGFAFLKEVYPAEFYDEKCASGELVSFAKMIDDFALGQLSLSLSELICLFLNDAQRQFQDSEYLKALERLKHDCE